MNRFTPDFLEDLRRRAPIVDVVGRKVALKQRGRGDWWGLSPFVAEKTASFHVLEDQGFYKCFSSQKSGDVIGFVMETEGLSFAEAVESLAREAGLPLPAADPQAAENARRRAGAYEALARAQGWFADQLNGADGAEARAYCARRGLDAAAAARFGLGFSPPRRGALRASLNADGFTDAVLIDAGLLKQPDDGGAPFDFFRGRLMFPVRDRQNRVIGFGARALGDGQPKYLNSPESAAFRKGEALYGWSWAREATRKGAPLIVVEGYMDVIALALNGFDGAVAPLGTAVTESQIDALWRMADAPLFCLDGDRAGRAAAARAADRAWPRLKPGKTLRFCFLPDGEDPDSLARAGGADALRRALNAATPLAAFVWTMETQARDLSTPEARAALATALDRRIGDLGARAVAAAYAADFDQRWAAAFGAPRTTGPAAPAAGRRNDEASFLRGYREGRAADLYATPPTPEESPAFRDGYQEGLRDARANRRRAPRAIESRRSWARKPDRDKAAIARLAEIDLLTLALRAPARTAADIERFGAALFADPAARAARDAIVDLLTETPDACADALRARMAALGPPLGPLLAAESPDDPDPDAALIWAETLAVFEKRAI